MLFAVPTVLASRPTPRPSRHRADIWPHFSRRLRSARTPCHHALVNFVVCLAPNRRKPFHAAATQSSLRSSSPRWSSCAESRPLSLDRTLSSVAVVSPARPPTAALSCYTDSFRSCLTTASPTYLSVQWRLVKMSDTAEQAANQHCCANCPSNQLNSLTLSQRICLHRPFMLVLFC